MAKGTWLIFCAISCLIFFGAVNGRPEAYPEEEEGGGTSGEAEFDDRTASQSSSFIQLRDNVVAVLENLPSDEVDDADKATLVKAFKDIFADYEKKRLEELQPAGEKLRRIPYGTIHRLAHETIDNLDLKTSSLQHVHRAIHFAFTNSYSEDHCFPQFAKNHTGCLERQGKTGCNKISRGINEKDKQIILDLHDEYRSEVARGDAKIRNVTLPTAVAMAKMAWDEELATLAQAWADQCTFATDCEGCRRTDRLRFVGQSLVRFKHLPSPLTRSDWKHAIDTWARRSKADLPVDTSDILTNFRSGDAWSAYTQMIWDFSYLLGCGFSMYKDPETGKYSQLYVCNYGPAGNVVGTQIYAQGPACSKCPRSHVCEPETKLCTYDEDGSAPPGFVRKVIASKTDITRSKDDNA